MKFPIEKHEKRQQTIEFSIRPQIRLNTLAQHHCFKFIEKNAYFPSDLLIEVRVHWMGVNFYFSLEPSRFKIQIGPDRRIKCRNLYKNWSISTFPGPMIIIEDINQAC